MEQLSVTATQSRSKSCSPTSESVASGQDAAQEDSSSTSTSNATKKATTKYRTGKWTEEETKYASQIIRCFGSGVLKLPPNKTLRSYLSGELDCDPMRVTKKFPGTALLMKEVSDETKPVPPQSVVQNALLKLKSLEDSFRERLRKDRLKQGSRPSVFSLMDEEIAVANSQTYPSPASADIVQPKQTTTGMPLTTALSTTNQQQFPSLPQFHQAMGMHQGMAATAALTGMNGAVPGFQNAVVPSFAQGDQQQQQQQQQLAIGINNIQSAQQAPVSSENMALLLSSATAGSPLAAALSTPFVLGQLWKLQEEQEEQLRKQRAALIQLSPPGYQPTRSVTPPMNNNINNNGVQQQQTNSQQQHHQQQHHALPLNNNHMPNFFMNNSFSSTTPAAQTLPHSQSTPNLGMFTTPAAAPSTAPVAAPVATPAHLNPPAAFNPMFLNQLVNTMPMAATPMPQQQQQQGATSTMTSTTTNAAAPAMVNTPMMAAPAPGLQMPHQHAQLPNWLAMMTPNAVRKV